VHLFCNPLTRDSSSSSLSSAPGSDFRARDMVAVVRKPERTKPVKGLNLPYRIKTFEEKLKIERRGSAPSAAARERHGEGGRGEESGELDSRTELLVPRSASWARRSRPSWRQRSPNPKNHRADSTRKPTVGRPRNEKLAWCMHVWTDYKGDDLWKMYASFHVVSIHNKFLWS
jgi:hypothetical protein